MWLDARREPRARSENARVERETFGARARGRGTTRGGGTTRAIRSHRIARPARGIGRSSRDANAREGSTA